MRYDKSTRKETPATGATVRGRGRTGLEFDGMSIPASDGPFASIDRAMTAAHERRKVFEARSPKDAAGNPLYTLSQGGNIRRTRKLSQRKKEQIKERDGWRCVLCSVRKTYGLEVDHIIPYRDGGSDDPSNLRSLCHACHVNVARKGR